MCRQTLIFCVLNKLANNNNNTTGGVSNAAGASNSGAQQGASNASNRAGAPVGENVPAAGDWNPEECDRFSFDDSDRFEEDSLCSWSSEPESLCNNWRGWKRPSTNQQIISSINWFTTTSVSLSQKKSQDNDQVISLTELAAKCVASFIPFELVEHVYPPVPEQLQLRIAFWSFPDNEEDIRLYSCLANSSADEFHRGDQLFKNRAVKDPLQIGFHLSATVISQQPRAQFNVAVTFDRRRVSSCNCTCTSSAYWCSHVVAVCLHRIHCPNEVCLRAPVSESLTRLQRDQLQKFAQYLISELPQQILPTAQRLLDELLSSQPTAINTVCGAPDPTAGASANDQTSWYLDEKTLHENIKRILIKFCLPAPIVFSDVNYLTNSAPPAAAEWSSLLRPLRGREPEGMWNLLSIVREMYRRCDRNAVRLLEIITEECMACDQILIWWFYTKLSMLVGTNGHSGGGGGKHSNTHSNSNASQHACSSLCDEIVVLWRLAALNPGLAPDERDMLHAQFTAWHLKILDRVVKCRMQPSSYNSSKHQQNSRSDAELFIGFKPAIEACYLDWEDYPITGVTHTQETNPIYYSPFTCFKHSDASKSDTSAVSSQVNSSQAALMANNTKHYSYISSSDHHYSHLIMKSRYENRPFRNSCTSAVVNSGIIASSVNNDYSINNSNCNSSESANLRLKASNNLNKNSNLPGVPGSSKNISQSMNDGNHSSASSEGFCENNDDFCGDNSGGQTLQPPVGVRLTQQQPENQKSQESLMNENNKDIGIDITGSSAINTNSNSALNKKQTNLAGSSGVITVTDVNKFLTNIKNNCKGNPANSSNSANINVQQQQIDNGLTSSHMISSASSSSSSSSSSVPLSLSASSTSSSSCAAVGIAENAAGSSKDFTGIEICVASNRNEARRQSKDDSSTSSSEVDEMGAVGGIVPKIGSNEKISALVVPNISSAINLAIAPPAPPPATSTVPQFLAQYNYSQYSIVYGKPGGNTKQQIFSNLRPSEDAWDILLARAEGLHAHGHGREACILAVRLAEEMLTHPPNLMIELPQPPRRKGKKQNINPINHQLSVLASATLSKCAFLCTVLAENSEHYHLAFRTCLFALEMPRPPASTKPLEVKLANQEADLLAVLKKIPLNQAELRVIRERADQLKSGTIKSRGEALLPINLASFIFDALVMPSISGKENRNKLMSLPYRNPTDENLGFEAAVAALGMKANVSEAEHPLLCEGTRRQRGDLALTLLSYYKDEPRKIAKIMEKLLDREIHVLLKQPLLPAYYSNNPPVRTPATQSRRQEQDLLYSSNPEVYSEFATVPGGNSRPHSSTSAEIEIGMGGLSVSSQTSLPSAQQATGLNISTGATSRSKDLRYKGKRAYPSIPNQPSEASAHFMFELAKNVLTKAGGTSSTSLFTQATTNQNHHGPHRALHMCAFQLGLYALGLHNCVSPNWLSRTYSSHVSWIIGQAMEIGAPAISFLIDTWEGHLTPPEAAGMADRASRGWDNNMVYPAAELALSVLPHAPALNPNEIQRAILQCKEQSDQMLERACITVENAAKGGGVYPEVLFQVARYWYELYLRNTPNSEQEHDGNDIDHSVSLSALLDSQAAEVAAVAAHQQLQAQQQQQSQSPPQQPSQIAGQPQQVVVTSAPPPYPQGVSTLAPLNIAPYPPYSFCPSIYHHHSLAAYPGNQMQMYISAAPQNVPPPPHQAYQYPPPSSAQQQQQPPQISGAQSQPSVYGGPPNGFQSMPPPPIVNQQQQQQQSQPPPAVYSQPMQCPPGSVPPPANYNQQLVQMQQNMQYYTQSMAMAPPPQQSGSLRLQPNHHGIVYPYIPQQQPPHPPQQQPAAPHQMQRQRHPHQYTATQLRYLLAAYNVGMLAMETLARRVHDDRPQAKYARNPPYGEDVKWLLRISKKLGTQYLHQFCICAVNSIVSPFVLHDVAIESAHYLGRNNHALVMQHLRSALTPLVQKCQQMYIQCIHQKLYHLTQADYEDFANIILAARAAFQITPEGNAQFKDWLQSIKRSKSCKKDLWAQINTALQSNSK